MRKGAKSTPTELRTRAEITLTVVCAAVGSSLAKGSQRFRLPSISEVSTWDEAVEVLMAHDKPLKCTGSVTDGVVSLALHTLTPGSEADGHAFRAADLAMFVSAQAEARGIQLTATTEVAIQGLGTTVSATWGDLAAWANAYDTPGYVMSLYFGEPGLQSGPSVGVSVAPAPMLRQVFPL